MKGTISGCHIARIFANMKCTNCFGAEVVCFEEGKADTENKGQCDCRLKLNPELMAYGFE